MTFRCLIAIRKIVQDSNLTKDNSLFSMEQKSAAFDQIANIINKKE